MIFDALRQLVQRDFFACAKASRPCTPADAVVGPKRASHGTARGRHPTEQLTVAGRPRKPTAVKEAMGNPGKRASARSEPDPTYLEDLSPPYYLSDGARVVWLEEAPKFRRARLLTEVDVMAFAALCQAAADYRRAVAKTGEADVKVKLQADEDGKIVEVGEHLNPWAMVKSMASKQMGGWLGKFGGTPQDRTRVEVNPQASLFPGDGKPKDPAATYFSH